MSWPTTCWSASATCSVTCPSQVPSLSRSTKPPRRPREHECSRRPGSSREQLVGEPGQGVGRELLEAAEVDDEVDRPVVVPDVGAAVDPGLDDLRGRGRATQLMGGSVAGHGGAVGRVAASSRTVGLDVTGRDVTGQLAQVTPGRGQLGDRTQLVDLAPRSTWASSGMSARVVRSKRAPAGSTCSTTPEARIGEVALGLVGVGDHVGAVEDRDRAAADHPQHRAAGVVADHGAGVLVDADAEQLRALGHDHQQPTVAVALLEVLVDHAAGRAGRARRRPGSSAAWASYPRSRRRPCARTGC